MDEAKPRIAMVAGEASGDLLAGMLLAALRQRWPTLAAVGIGGPKMAAQGFHAWWPHDKLAVRGYAEVLRHYWELVSIRRQLGERLLRERPEVFIGVDAPDFNLGLEARLKAAGIKTLHFICPSIWAWRGGRARIITDLNQAWGTSDTCTKCGKCVMSCPTGALFNKGSTVGEMERDRTKLEFIVTAREKKQWIAD